MGTGYRATVDALEPQQQARLRTEVVGALRTAKVSSVRTDVVFATAVKPSGADSPDHDREHCRARDHHRHDVPGHQITTTRPLTCAPEACPEFPRRHRAQIIQLALAIRHIWVVSHPSDGGQVEAAAGLQSERGRSRPVSPLLRTVTFRLASFGLGRRGLACAQGKSGR